MSEVRSGRDARGRATRLPAAMRARQWRPGESGNPAGQSGLYGETVKLAREAAPAAVRRLIELMASPDERVAAVARNAILDRAFGKPRDCSPESEGGPDGHDVRDTRARNLALIEEIARRARPDGGDGAPDDPHGSMVPRAVAELPKQAFL